MVLNVHSVLPRGSHSGTASGDQDFPGSQQFTGELRNPVPSSPWRFQMGSTLFPRSLTWGEILPQPVWVWGNADLNHSKNCRDRGRAHYSQAKSKIPGGIHKNWESSGGYPKNMVCKHLFPLLLLSSHLFLHKKTKMEQEKWWVTPLVPNPGVPEEVWMWCSANP